MRLSRDLLCFTWNRLHSAVIGNVSNSVARKVHFLTKNFFGIPSDLFSLLLETHRRAKWMAVIIYDLLKRESAKLMDPVVQEFRAKYPESARHIGDSFPDRLLLLLWLMFMLRIFILFVTLPIKAVFQRLGRKSSLVVFPPLYGKKTSTPEPMTPSRSAYRETSPPKTTRKRIVIAKRM